MTEDAIMKSENKIMEELRDSFRDAYLDANIYATMLNSTLADVIELIEQKNKIIEKYQKADTFLAAHGWKWENVK